MAEQSLTTVGFVSQFMDNKHPDSPKVQIYQIQEKPNALMFVVNDGEHCMHGAFSKELKQQYDANELKNFKENAIIKLQEYKMLKQQNRTVCVITKFETESFTNGRIGNPKPFSQTILNTNSSNTSNNSNASNSSSNGTKNYQPISSLNPYQSSWRIKVRVTQKSQMRSYMKDGKENFVFSVNLLDHEGTEIQATMFNEACKKFYPKFEEQSIYYISNARVTVARRKYTHIKNDYAIIINENSEVTFVPSNDENAGNSTSNSIKTIGNGNDKNNNNNNNNTNESDDIIMKQVYRFVKICDISNCEQGDFVDVCGIVYEVKEMSQIISKKTGKSLNRRVIVLCDNSLKLIELTVWGNMALEFDEKRLENHAIIVLKAARISEYAGNKQLICNNNILINPFDSVKEAKILNDWWQNMVKNGESENLKFESLAPTAGAGMGGSGSKVPRLTVSEVKESKIGLNDTIFDTMSPAPKLGQAGANGSGNNQNKGSYFSMIGTILRSFEVNRDNTSDKKRFPWYKACSDPNANNAKVTEISDGKYYCLKTNKEYLNYIPRYVTRFAVSDESGQIWLSAFNDAATMILGTECKIVENYYNNGNFKDVDKVFKSCLFKKFVFRVRAKSQEYNGEQRVRYDLLSVQPVDYAIESQNLMEKIEQFRTMSC